MRGRELERRVDVRQQCDDFGAREGQRGGADIEEAVAEGVDVRAIDVGDGAVGAHAHIAGHELHADHRAGFEVGRIAHASVRICRPGGDALAGFEAQGAQLRREGIERGRG